MPSVFPASSRASTCQRHLRLLGMMVLLAACILQACNAAWGQSPTVVTFGTTNPVRLEFWNATDGRFDWYGTENRQGTLNWTPEKMQAVTRGMSYWWDVLGSGNQPGRAITIRVIHGGQSLRNGNWTNYDSSAASGLILTGSIYQNTTTRTWAGGSSSPPTQIVDSVINFDATETLFALNGPLQRVPGVGIEATMIHEFAHTLGMSTGEDHWGIHNGSGQPLGLELFETMVVKIDGSGQRIPVVLGEAFSKEDPFFFNGQNARVVYGEALFGDAGVAVPLTTLSTQKSHLGIDALTMTHQSWRNYPFFTEVELAVIQDLGYSLNRHDFFGKSYYVDGAAGGPQTVNTSGFDSASTYGVGMHLKANQRDILQTADLIASGIAGNGIRIDGDNNRVTIDSGVSVLANGDFGVGVLVSNGRKNVVVHRGAIQADSSTAGAVGTGILIGFGPNTLGENPQDSDYSRTSQSMGDFLVDRLDVSGTVSAGSGVGNAIEIDRYAAIKEINIMAGAQLSGHVRSNGNVGFDRPDITFGKAMAADGTATANVDENFTFDFAGEIGGDNLMDAQFVGGKESQTGTRLSGPSRFHEVAIGASGRLTIDGSLLAGDAFSVQGILTSIAGQIVSAQAVSVQDGGRLTGTGTINAPLVDNQSGGTMAAGNSIGILSIVGNYQTNGTLEYEITHQNVPQDSDLIAVQSGIASINNQTSFENRGTFAFDAEAPHDAASYEVGRRYTILQTDGPGNLQVFQRPKTTDNIDGRRIILRTDADVSHFDTPGAQYYFAYIGRDTAYASFGHTTNQQAVGQYLDAIFAQDDNSPLGSQIAWFRDSLDLLPYTADVLSVLNQWSGDLYASIDPMLVQQIYSSQNQLVGRLRQPGARLAWCDEDGEQVRSALGGWMSGVGAGGATDSDGNAVGYGYSAAGTQVVVTYGLSCDTLTGGYFNYTSGQFRADGGGSARAVLNEFGGLLTHHGEIDYVLLVAGGGVADIGASRQRVFGNPSVQAPVVTSSTANYNGQFADVYGEYGRDYEVAAYTLRPFAGLGYVVLAHCGFEESGAGPGTLAISGGTFDSLRSMLGIDVLLPFDAASKLSLEARAAWMHDFLTSGVGDINARFAGTSGPGFNVLGAPLGRDFAVIGVNASRNLRQNVRIYGGYDLFANAVQSLNSGNLGLEVLW